MKDMSKVISIRLSAEEYETAQELLEKLRNEGLNLTISEVFRMSLRNEAKRQLNKEEN